MAVNAQRVKDFIDIFGDDPSKATQEAADRLKVKLTAGLDEQNVLDSKIVKVIKAFNADPGKVITSTADPKLKTILESLKPFAKVNKTASPSPAPAAATPAATTPAATAPGPAAAVVPAAVVPATATPVVVTAPAAAVAVAPVTAATAPAAAATAPAGASPAPAAATPVATTPAATAPGPAAVVVPAAVVPATATPVVVTAPAAAVAVAPVTPAATAPAAGAATTVPAATPAAAVAATPAVVTPLPAAATTAAVASGPPVKSLVTPRPSANTGINWWKWVAIVCSSLMLIGICVGGIWGAVHALTGEGMDKPKDVMVQEDPKPKEEAKEVNTNGEVRLELSSAEAVREAVKGRKGVCAACKDGATNPLGPETCDAVVELCDGCESHGIIESTCDRLIRRHLDKAE